MEGGRGRQRDDENKILKSVSAEPRGQIALFSMRVRLAVCMAGGASYGRAHRRCRRDCGDCVALMGKILIIQ